MTRVFRVASCAVLGLVLGAPLVAQQQSTATAKPAAPRPQAAALAPVPVQEARPGLQQMAKVTPEAAEATALASVRNGKITSARIVQEQDSSLVYDFKIMAGGKEHDVRVNATTGTRVMAMSSKRTGRRLGTGKS
jgi:uncharacterized membrane protein YkoI